MFYSFAASPLGELLLAGCETNLRVIRFPERRNGGAATAAAPEPGWQRRDDVFAAAKAQLAEYFAGTRRDFSLRLAPAATPFQATVLRALQAIPYGETRSYGEVARSLGRPRAVRAVGGANARNPLPIVIPCHRVVGADGGLTGFGGGLPAKRYLLRLEQLECADAAA